MTTRTIVVLLPAGSAAVPLTLPGAQVRRYRDAAELRELLRAADEAFVLCSDGLPRPDADALAVLIRELGRTVIEVRGERWDGASPSPLSAACRGVISGFGLAGVRAAVALLQREAVA